MTKDQVIRVASEYREEFVKNIESAQFTNHDNMPTVIEQAKHCSYMCDKIISGELPFEKSMRWLCFVQGVLWSLGYKSITQMKDDNR
jgi:hypothetical protein